MKLQEKLLGRFLRYAAVTTQSKPESGKVPSTPGQWELARLLAKDIEELGVRDITVDEHAIVIGRLPARLPKGHGPVPVVGWETHMDTVEKSNRMEETVVTEDKQETEDALPDFSLDDILKIRDEEFRDSTEQPTLFDEIIDETTLLDSDNLRK